MSDTALAIYDKAALGSLVAFSDGASRPPDRHRRKLRDWEDRNGRGRLVARTPAWRDDVPDTFTLHLGDYGSQGTIVIVLKRTYGTDSALTFAVARPPEPGTVQVITGSDGCEELVHRASCHVEAEVWAARNYYRDARFVVVGERVELEAAEVAA